MLWLTFTYATLASCIILFIPGFLLLKSLGFSRFVALCAAPLLSLFLICVGSTTLSFFSLSCNALTVFILIFGISFLAYIIVAIIKPWSNDTFDIACQPYVTFFSKRLPYRKLTIALYILCGVCVWLYVVLPCFTGSPDALFSRWDNQTHMNQVRASLDSDIWSLSSSGSYLNESSNNIPMNTSESTKNSFYPLAWHIITAFVCSIINCPAPLGANAVNLVISSVVFPLGMLLLHTVLFPKNKKTILSGAVITMSFTAYPWGLFVKGPLYPNLLGLAVLPIFLGLFIFFFEYNYIKQHKLIFSFLFVTGLVMLTTSQPNTVFVAFIFLAAYGGHYINKQFLHSTFPMHTRRIITAGYAALIVTFWIICFNLPFLQGVVSYEWAPIKSVPFAFAMAGSFAMPSFYPEPLLAIAAFVGLLGCIKKKTYWILIPAFFMMVAFALDRSTTNLIRHLLSGFWYTDPFRSAANYAIFVCPIASFGFSFIFDWLNKNNKHFPLTLKNPSVLYVVLVVTFSIITFAPTIPLSSLSDDLPNIKTAFGTLHSRFKDAYRTDIEQVFSIEEQAFIDKVLEAIPEDAMVINQPCDGSVFAYATDDLRTYYRHCSTSNQTEAANLIRLSLNELASNNDVQNAVASTDAKYVLQLDQGVSYEDGVWLPQYKSPDLWKGIDAIRDDTPGFKLILSEGDMRLFEIEDVDAAA